MASKKITTDTKTDRASHNSDFVNNEQSKREQMIAYAAYFRAEKRGFAPNNDQADWFEAEAEIDRRLTSFSS